MELWCCGVLLGLRVTSFKERTLKERQGDKEKRKEIGGSTATNAILKSIKNLRTSNENHMEKQDATDS